MQDDPSTRLRSLYITSILVADHTSAGAEIASIYIYIYIPRYYLQ